MEHGLKYIMCYVQKHIAPQAMCCNPPPVHDKQQEATAFVKLVYYLSMLFKGAPDIPSGVMNRLISI